MVHPWEKEYQSPQFLSLDTSPQKSVRKFIRFLKKQEVPIQDAKVLDLGCGNGRNSMYFASLGASVTGYDISATAIAHARQLARTQAVKGTFAVHNIGEHYPMEDHTIDIILDVTASNGLTPDERESYVKEISRVIKQGGYLFVRTLCLDSDTNAKQLLKMHPGPYPQTYTMPQTQITERVFSKQEMETLYANEFELLSLKKTSGYMNVDGKTYKRYVWLAYFRRK